MVYTHSKYFREVVTDMARFLIDLPYYIYLTTISISFCLLRYMSPRKNKSLDMETILVTGAAAGIGREVVFHLAKLSTAPTIVLWDINENGLLETRNECLRLGVSSVYTYVVDLSKMSNVTKAAKLVRREVGPVTILFNNAGLLQYEQFLHVRPEIEERIFKVNFLSYAWTLREFLPGMIENGDGHIVSTCSGLAHMRFHNMAAYVASKYALNGFLECLKLEMRNHPEKPNIKFTTIYPGWIKTSMINGITWEPRYKTWTFLHQLEVSYVAEKIMDGILKEKKEVYVPRSIQFMKYFYWLIPAELLDRIERFLHQNLKID